MRKLSLTFLFIFVVLSSGITSRADENASCGNWAGYIPQGVQCRDCSCAGARQAGGNRWGCYGVRFGDVTCVDNNYQEIFTENNVACRNETDYPQGCHYWDHDISPQCITGAFSYYNAGEDITQGNTWWYCGNSTPRALNSFPTATPVPCTRQYTTCGCTQGVTYYPTKQNWYCEEDPRTTGCSTTNACQATPTGNPPTPTYTPPPTPTYTPTPTPTYTPTPTRTPTPTPTTAPPPLGFMRVVVRQNYCTAGIGWTRTRTLNEYPAGTPPNSYTAYPSYTIPNNASYSFDVQCKVNRFYNVDVNLQNPPGAAPTIMVDNGDECGEIVNFTINCPSPTRTPTPTPTAIPAPDVQIPICVTTPNDPDDTEVTWSNPNVSRVDITTSTDFTSNIYSKAVSGNITFAPRNFSPVFNFLAETRYRVRTWNGTRYSVVRIYDTPVGCTPTPLPSVPVNTSTPVPPTATPTQSPWFQVKGTSLQSSNTVTSEIPVSPMNFDNTTGERHLILGTGPQEAGGFSAPGINLGPTVPAPNPTQGVSNKGWKAQPYSISAANINDFVSYVKAKKSFNSMGNLTTLVDNKINIISVASLTISSDAEEAALTQNPQNPLAIIIENGNLTINLDPSNTVFNDANKPIIFILPKGSVVVQSGTTTTLNGIFISAGFNTGTNTDQGLQINGNLITNNLINGRKWNTTSNARPSLYVNADVGMYVKLFDFITKSTFQWEQLK